MPSYETNVFVNCPFDEDYKPLLRVMIFVIKATGLTPRLASERADSGEVRLHKIKELIDNSRYSIHDLSRCQAAAGGEYLRMNMPFELRLDLGCRYYHPEPKYHDKKQLILEGERYSTQKALSDLSFADCESHGNDAEILVSCLRNWFIGTGMQVDTSPSSLWDKYNYFSTDLYERKQEEGFTLRDLDSMSTREYLSYVNHHFPAS